MESTVRRLYDEVYTKCNLNVCDELFSSGLKLHTAAVEGGKSDITSFKTAESTYHKAIPNKKATIEDLMISDNKVIVRWSCKGKQDGELFGNAPTHRPFTISGISIYLFTNDKISEIWQSWDRLSLCDQIGISPPSHATHR